MPLQLPAISPSTPLLQARGLAQSRGERLLFEGLDFALHAGHALWVRGANGSGKSSLLRLLAKLAEPLHGEVRVGASNLFYAGHAAGLKDELSAAENLVFNARLAGQRCDAAALQAALQAFGLQHVAGVPARALSQGQRRRVALARLALPGAPRLWLLDEPFAALDADAAQALLLRLDAHLAAGGVLVCTTHQPLQLRAPCHTLDLTDDPASWQLQWQLH
jgi:heme exporter protein A